MPDAADNTAQVAYWNETAGPRWVRLQQQLDAQLGAHGEAVIEAAAPGRGDRVLDVGCGCGALALGAAARVAPDGRVLGVDPSGPMLARAQERATESALPGIAFLQADAQTEPFRPGGFDQVLSRFGVMFFADPEAAFENLRKALAPGGTLGFVCWQGIDRNTWMSAPRAAAMKHLPEMPAAPDPLAPGPFAFADRDRVARILAAAGFEGVAIDPLEGDLPLGGAQTVDEAAAFAVEIGPAAAALREAGADEAVRLAVRRDTARALAPFQRSDGVHAPYAAWCVTAKAPA